MILVYGSDRSFVDDVVTYLEHGGQRALRVPMDAHLLSEVVAHKADTVIGLEAGRPSFHDAERQQLLDALHSASAAPSAPRIVLVTSAPLDGAHVRALKGSGAPYVVVSSIGLRTLSRDSRLERRSVWLSQRLLAREHALVTKSALLCTLTKAVAEDNATGIELSPDSANWREALQAAGVRVRAVPNWLARLAYFFGAPALYLAAGRAFVRLDDQASEPVLAALPMATGAI
jgi:hypothetical protein